MDNFEFQLRRENQLIQEQGRSIEENLRLSSKLSASLAKLSRQIQQVTDEQRQLELQARETNLVMGSQMKGDIDGVVVGEWQRLNEDGTGSVNYNDKEYKTVPLKLYSTTKGKKVQMIYEKGTYYSQM